MWCDVSMSQFDVTGWVAAGIAAVSAGVAVWQTIEARRARKSSERNARASDASAKIAAESASEAAIHLGRLADLREAEAAAVTPPWRVDLGPSGEHRLVNTGDEPCREVTVRVDDPEAVFHGWDEPTDIQQGSHRTFVYAPTIDTDGDVLLTVTWHLDRHPERMEWTLPL